MKLSFSTELCLKKNDDNITLDEVNFLYQTASEYIEDITRWREDMNFIFEWQLKTVFYERAQRVSKILFLP